MTDDPDLTTWRVKQLEDAMTRHTREIEKVRDDVRDLKYDRRRVRREQALRRELPLFLGGVATVAYTVISLITLLQH